MKARSRRNVFALLLGALLATTTVASSAEYRTLPGGSFASALPPDGKIARAELDAFELRSEPVTNAEFLRFVATHPEWQRGHVASLFAESRYLGHWAAPLVLGDHALAEQPVTQVSWFAARAYCESENARLPTWHEWEFAAAADNHRADARADPAWRERILGWYAQPSGAPLANAGSGEENFYGVRDLHGLVWEWVDDVSSLMVSGDNREQGDADLLRFCGAGALSMQDRDNFAVLMRVAMLSSLKAADTTRNLGFRCARDRDAP